LFVFEPELESLGFWYEQLISESLGKNHKGITPITSVGSRDFHSEMQLDLDGPKDKAFTFLWVKNRDSNIKLKKQLELNVREEIQGKDTESIGNAILQAAKHSYENLGIKTFSLCLDSLSLYELGYFMQYKMLEVAFLGHIMKIDTFLQPAVEDYKKETVEILTKNS
jgi:glucose-6-phosphate isomerase